MKKKTLNRIVDDLAAQSELRKTAVFALAHAVKPTTGFRLKYSMYAVTERFTAEEVRAIDDFFRWASRRDDSLTARDLYGRLTREELIESFDEYVPSRKGKLEEILKIDRADGEYGVWMKWAEIVLDAGDVTNENENKALQQETENEDESAAQKN